MKDTSRASQSRPPKIVVSQDQGTLSIRLTGSWTMGDTVPDIPPIEPEKEGGQAISAVVVDGRELGEWDSQMLAFLLEVRRRSKDAGLDFGLLGFPDGVLSLIDLVGAAAEQDKGVEKQDLVVTVGVKSLGLIESFLDTLTFLGETTLALGKFFLGRARYRRVDLLESLRSCGADALPIVSLISFLVGLILAFVGSTQLEMFGAQIYVANLVGLGMAREMGAMMTAIVMAGRTGAAFAAQLGTMTANEEIDALRTLGISPIEFLVLPRVLALTVMMPLLCLYSVFMGILGGLVVAVGMLDITSAEYMTQTRSALTLTHFGVGLIKSVVYGVLVAFAGCLRGMQSGRSALSVGTSTTSAVVTAIVLVIVASALLTFIYNLLGI
ncbi:MAG: ABC transporter permease [Desulfohalobiaceae bacterium]